MNWELIRNNLRQQIDRAHVSHNELARLSGVDQPTISRFLRDATHTMTLDNLGALARPLHCTVGQLIGERPLDASSDLARILNAIDAMPAYKLKALAAVAESLAKQ